MQKILTLIITAAIIYMIIQQNLGSITLPKPQETKDNQNDTKTESQPDPALSGSFLEKTLSSVLINVLKTDEGRIFMESMIQPMNKSVAGSGKGFSMNSNLFIDSIFKISTFGDGEGEPAICGQVATVHYKILSGNNTILEEKIDTFPLGGGKTVPGLDAVVVGMKAGQTRHATITNKYIQGTTKDKASSFRINVLLKSVMPQNTIKNDVKIFDDQLAYRIPLVCGNKAIYDAKITQLSNGKVIYNSVDSGKQINMSIGNLSYPVIFSHALHNKIPIGSRTVIAPGRLFKSYLSDNSAIFPQKTLPQDEYFMVEFFNFDDSIKTDQAVFNQGKVK